MTAAMLTPGRPPPEDYYQNNWRILLEFVATRHRALLEQAELSYLTTLLQMSDDAQRLCARLLTRKGPLIREDSLAYAEVTDTDAALVELASNGVIVRNGPAPADLLLNLMRKAELVDAFGNLPRGVRKETLCLTLLGRHADRALLERIGRRLAWLEINHGALWRLVKLLYFGDAEHDWSAFVIRDLGMVKYEDIPMTTPRFAGAHDLAEELGYRELARLSRRVEEFPELAGELRTRLRHPHADRFVESRRQRALMRIGQWHERRRDVAEAVDAYAAAAMPPARERIVRTLHRAGESADAESWLEQIRRQPLTEEELQFAERFGKRGAGYQPEVRTLVVDAVEPDVEAQALELVLEEGQWGAHVENSLVRTLTGLQYWEAIFADVQGAFTNPFQFAPNDLYRDDFASVRLHVIEAIEARSDAETRSQLLRRAEDRHGVANSLVNWQMLDAIGLDALLDAMPIGDIRRLTAFLIRNLAHRRAGLPDLFVCRGKGQYELIEVKGPTDQLQPGQRVWFSHLERLEIPACVLKLKLAPVPPASTSA